MISLANPLIEDERGAVDAGSSWRFSLSAAIQLDDLEYLYTSALVPLSPASPRYLYYCLILPRCDIKLHLCLDIYKSMTWRWADDLDTNVMRTHFKKIFELLIHFLVCLLTWFLFYFFCWFYRSFRSSSASISLLHFWLSWAIVFPHFCMELCSLTHHWIVPQLIHCYAGPD